MTFALSVPAGVPRDEGERAADLAELDRDIALRTHLAAVEILEDQDIDADGNVVCLDCPTIIPPKRLAAIPHAVRCAGCQEEHEKRRQIETGRGRP